METNTLDGNRRTTADAMSMIASVLPASVLPASVPPACAPAARVRPELDADTRSLAGVGAYGVPGNWRRAVRFGAAPRYGIATSPALSTTVMMAGLPILAVDQQDPKFSTHNFTRLGPPTCSPPV